MKSITGVLLRKFHFYLVRTHFIQKSETEIEYFICLPDMLKSSTDL